VRILHFADVHLDRPFVGFAPQVARRRRRELFDAFRRCLALAAERGADLVTIGGDLWEEEHVRGDTRLSVAHELARIELPVLVVCGNHDPLRPGGSYRRTPWPDNVTIVDRGRLHEYRYGEVSVWAMSWGAAAEPSQRMLETLELSSTREHVLVVHGTAHGAAFVTNAHFPFDPGVVESAGFSICLAGHVHCATELGRVVYPGSPEPLGWGEASGRHCVAVVECGTGSPNIELVDVNRTRYATRRVDCSGCASSAEIDERVRAALQDKDPETLFLRLGLTGQVGADCAPDVERVAAAHASRYGALVVENATEPLLDLAARAERKGLDGRFTRKLLQRLEEAEGDGERRRIELALESGLQALDGRDVNLNVD
jgi:DNA repair exonuclease SbcCD nuclease subunit